MRLTFSRSQRPEFNREHESSAPHIKSNQKTCNTLMLLLCAVSGLVGFWAGSRSDLTLSAKSDSVEIIPPSRDHERIFEFNRSFVGPSDHLTEAAWASLFPEAGEGFVHHPQNTSDKYGIAVYHQLHCLKSLYSANYDQYSEVSQTDHDQTGKKHEHKGHATHCLEYLRQSIICSADTYLEPWNYSMGKVTGWGTRKCRDLDSVAAFASRYRFVNSPLVYS